MKTNFIIPNYKGLEIRIKEAQKNILSMVKLNRADLDKYENSKHYRKNINKIQKAVYLKENYRTFEQFDSENLVNYFRNQEDFDSWIDVYFFKKTDMEIIEKELEEMYVEIDGSSWSSPYDCTGRAFFRQCNFYELSDRIVVTQSGGLDV
jgi:hypothetical protein